MSGGEELRELRELRELGDLVSHAPLGERGGVCVMQVEGLCVVSVMCCDALEGVGTCTVCGVRCVVCACGWLHSNVWCGGVGRPMLPLGVLDRVRPCCAASF